MSANPTPQGFALLLIVLGGVVMLTATIGTVVTHEHVWKAVVAAGGAVQVAGWLLHARRLRRLTGGAR
ncbi:putative membrane protein [Streptomyces scabiei 87.22]|uniref:Putative membrane protein n=1 Tax=Streptomyces scabiei (strain 87.22) TaxID=680198 RepID=C9Z131_STRSW|nr:hypothetical protein [Streptomyces scabiei]MDX2577713.1 hypothetical protein [Streptomyces scabiei]MDX2656126.1 hypothetical protein [Streptomyces scabiei]MDX2723040.1 hypothetical protein [Streptomyces scabiei]MDX2868738.1 hypothetical protein [Streptomyces scabiei]MDX2886666.1 hypothetical protein [Streptomyces scabiei]